MTKSRTLPGLIALAACLAWPAAAAVQNEAAVDPALQSGTGAAPTIVTADEALAMSRTQVRDLVASGCPPGTLDSDVVVCGRRGGVSRYRLPLPTPVVPGTGEQAGGEQLAAMDAGSARCSAVGRDQQCGGGFDIFAIGFVIVRGLVQALANRD